MAVGDIITGQRDVRVDAATGAVVERLTSPRATCHLFAPGVRVASRDGSVLLYVGKYGNSTRRLYALNLHTCTSVQIAAGRGLCEYNGVALDADDRHALYAQGSSLWSVDLVTLMRKRLYESESGWFVNAFSLSSDGGHIVLVEIEETAVPTNAEQPDWSYFALSTMAKPRCRIVQIDRAAHTSRVVLDEKCWLGFPTMRPGDPDTILYSHEGAFDFIDDRMWLVQSDGTGMRPVRSEVAGTTGGIASNEFWLPDGSAVGFLWRETLESDMEIHAIDIATGKERKLMDCSRYAHISAGADGLCVSDATGLEVPPHLLDTRGIVRDGDDADEEAAEDAGGFVYLVDLARGREVPLCRHGSSWRSTFGTAQDTHPHATLSPDGAWVYFVSDRDGHPAIYRADLARFRWEHGYDGVDSDALWGFGATYNA